MRSRFLLSLMLALCAVACTTPVSVHRVSARSVHRSLTANTLSGVRPSDMSTQILHQRNLFAVYEDQPVAALAQLREQMLAEVERTDLLFALAELEFHLGQRLEDRWLRRRDPRPHFLAAALYAHAFLRGLASDDPLIRLDPRLRIAADLYNRGLAAGLATDDQSRVDLSPRSLDLPFGELVLERDESVLLWAGYRMTDFVPASELAVRGLRNRYRRPGIGVPLAAALEPAPVDVPVPGSDHISEMVRVPATAVVRLAGGLDVLEGDRARGQLEVYTLDDATSMAIGDQEVALEYEPTAALAFGVAESRPWEFERRGFLSGDFGRDSERGLSMLGPYDPKRIPVVFVHGTASSPWRWAEMINQLTSDSTLLAGYQFWLFQYNTGNPVPFSAGLLRETLIRFVDELDPEGDDENLRRMVVVGHSQGGLLAKLCVVDSGDAFWNLVSQGPIDSLALRPATRETLKRSLFFDRLPFVQRVIFLATPFRGSFLAERWFVRLANGMVSLPRELVDAVGDLVLQDGDHVLLRGLDHMPSSIDNMRSDDRVLETLSRIPIAPGVEAHNIIAVRVPNDDPAMAHDGVVTVKSQRHPSTDTEFVVQSGHGTQRHPITIREVARILHRGLVEEREADAGAAP